MHAGLQPVPSLFGSLCCCTCLRVGFLNCIHAHSIKFVFLSASITLNYNFHIPGAYPLSIIWSWSQWYILIGGGGMVHPLKGKQRSGSSVKLCILVIRQVRYVRIRTQVFQNQQTLVAQLSGSKGVCNIKHRVSVCKACYATAHSLPVSG